MKISLNSKRAKEIRKRLAADNRKFQKLPKAKQRIAIAEDVIKQIKAKKFIADSVYFELGKESACENELGLEKVAKSDLDLGECIAQVGCQVCGIGSLFASAVMKHDKVKAKKFISVREGVWGDSEDSTSVDRSDEVQYLGKWFSADQLDLVEHFFEQHNRWCAEYLGRGWVNYDCDHPIINEYDPNTRLVMIMENIISNGGKFDPKQGKHSGAGNE